VPARTPFIWTRPQATDVARTVTLQQIFRGRLAAVQRAARGLIGSTDGLPQFAPTSWTSPKILGARQLSPDPGLAGPGHGRLC
jgi:hypothetical protein